MSNMRLQIGTVYKVTKQEKNVQCGAVRVGHAHINFVQEKKISTTFYWLSLKNDEF